MRDYENYLRWAAGITPKAEEWRLILGAGIALVSYVVVLYAMVLIFAPGPGGLMGASSLISTFVLFTSIGGMGLGAMIAGRAMHDRDPQSLIGTPNAVIWYFLRALRGLWPLWLFFVFLGFLAMGETRQFSALGWVALLPIAIPMVLLQTGAEELLFRGYFQSQLAARYRSPVIWMLLPSVLFGLLHYDGGDDINTTLFIMVWATSFGMMAADLTARTGNLGAAMAMHFANNLPLVIFYSVDGPTSGFALFTMADPAVANPLANEPMPISAMLIELISLLCFYLAIRIGIRR